MNDLRNLGISNWESEDIYETALHWADKSVQDFLGLKTRGSCLVDLVTQYCYNRHNA
ncbi:MAG: hypothetical protein UT66_C0037G0016 [candidate division CPR2 bacterium GW2011_GWC1_39_9]|nr:MAG: hypothetical protein UT66_C0037G0016 [candidate division CPR2 bacterium GW2011_GWC1_39_9]